MPASAETLRRELTDAFKGRAHMYRLLLAEFTKRHGADEAEDVLTTICEERGREVAPLLFAGLPADPEAIGRRFLSVSPDGGNLYPHDLDVSGGAFTVTVHACPLKAA